MFGFLSAPCSGCSSKEHSVYRAHFCGLCNRLRQDYGLHMRFLVNRDATFLSLLGNAMSPSPTDPVTTTCCNPLGKPRSVVQDGKAVSYAAAVTLCGLKAKLDDEVTDRGRRLTGFAFRGMRGLVSGPVERAVAYLNECEFPVDAVQEALEQQSLLEQAASSRGKTDLEELSRPSAYAFGKIVAHTGERARDSLEQIGQNLGRMIYLLDAVVDRARDKRAHQFNPFLLQPSLLSGLPELLDQELSSISTHMKTLPLSHHRDVLEVILGQNLRRTCRPFMEGSIPVHASTLDGKHPKQKQQQNMDAHFCNALDWLMCCDCCPTDCCQDGGCGSCMDCDACCCDCS